MQGQVEVQCLRSTRQKTRGKFMHDRLDVQPYHLPPKRYPVPCARGRGLSVH